MTTEIVFQFPVTIQNDARTFFDITGKFGRRIATGEEAAEYESVDGHRMWMTAAGEIYPE